LIRCLVVDDEKPARDEIVYLVNSDPDFEVVESFENGKLLLEAIDSIKPEVVFLDINMPGMGGLEVAEKIVQMDEEYRIVFVTAYDDYAVKAFEINAIDYLLKPVSLERMGKCLERVKSDLGDSTQYAENLKLLIEQVSTEKTEGDKKDHFCFHREGKLVPVKKNEIIFVKAENRGVLIETTKGSFTTNHQLRDLVQMIECDDFFRCHRSYIININFIEHIEPWFNRTYQVEMNGSEEKIPVSRNYIQEFKKRMHIF